MPEWRMSRIRLLLAAVVVAHLGIVYSIASSDRPIIWPLHNDTIHRAAKADFYAVYHAAVNVSRGLSPYDASPDGVTPYYYPFRYLPIVAHAARPLLQLSPPSAWFLWIVVIETLLFLLIFALKKPLGHSNKWVLTATLLLLSSPYFLELFIGQFTFAVVAACALAILLPHRGFFYGAVLLKVFPLVVLPAYLRQGQWKHIMTTLLVLAVATVPFAYSHPADLTIFFNTNFRPVGGLDSGNYGVLRLVHLLAVDLNFNSLLVHWDRAVAVARLLTFAACCWLVWTSRARQLVLGAAALLLAHFVTYQHVWEHHLSAVLVLGALLLTLPALSKRDELLLFTGLTLGALPTPFAFFDVAKDPAVWDPSIAWPRYSAYVLVLCKVIPTLIFFLWSVQRLYRPPIISAGRRRL